MCYGFACKLLDGNGRGDLQKFVPQVVVNERSSKIGLESLRTADSIVYFDDSLAGQLDLMFAQLPQDLLREGLKDGWTGTMKRGQRLLIK